MVQTESAGKVEGATLSMHELPLALSTGPAGPSYGFQSGDLRKDECDCPKLLLNVIFVS